MVMPLELSRNRQKRKPFGSHKLWRKQSFLHRSHTTKPDMRRCARNLAFSTSPGEIPNTVGIAAQKRSSPLDTLLEAGFLRVVAGCGARRIATWACWVIVGAIPVSAPFPDIATHIEQPKPVCRIGPNGGR